MTRAVVDCFPFFNELDVLEIRLTELDPVVDRFVAVEATTTHRGAPKPLHLTQNLERFARFRHKLDVVVVDLPSVVDTAWTRENAQREAITAHLGEGADDDVVLICDVDEIPRREVVANLDGVAPGVVAALDMDLHYYSLNWLVPDGPWQLARAAARSTVRAIGAQAVREAAPASTIPHAGWHLSYLYPRARVTDGIRDKVGAFAHEEVDRPDTMDERYLRRCVTHGFTYHERPRYAHRLRWVPIDGSFPHAITEAPERWSHLAVDRPSFHPVWDAVAVLGRVRGAASHRFGRAAAASP